MPHVRLGPKCRLYMSIVLVTVSSDDARSQPGVMSGASKMDGVGGW